MKKFILFIILNHFVFIIGFGQKSGEIDIDFNPVDFGFGIDQGANGTGLENILQPDGKIIIWGDFTSYNGTTRNGIARLNEDGSIDQTFNPVLGPEYQITTCAVQIDGKILIGGAFWPNNGIPRTYFARINSDGSIDTSFNPGSGTNGYISVIVAQDDGKILIGGAFTLYNGTTRNRIARINIDGSLDVSFNPVSGANNTVYSSAIQSDGKIIIAGNFSLFNGVLCSGITRLNSDGSVDVSFNPGNGANATIRTICIQNDGKILIGGEFTSYNETSRNYIARLATNGSIDNSFEPGTGASSLVRTIVVQLDGKIIIGGEFKTFNGTSRNHVVRLHPNGSVDTLFKISVGANNSVYSCALKSDGKIIIAGSFTTFNEYFRNNLARLNENGSVDNTFNSIMGANNWVRTSAVQSDGKIIIGGDFTYYNEIKRNRIARINPDGSIDHSFIPGLAINNTVHTCVLQNDGKIYVGGEFTSYDGIIRSGIARINTNGSLDASFNPPFSFPDYFYKVYTAALQSDGKIILGGVFPFYGANSIGIVRLNTDGSVDPSFNPGKAVNGPVYTSSIQSDGKVIIGGDFTSYNEITCNRIARINSNGSLDVTFNQNNGANSEVYTNAIQNDGKIIIGGNFTSYNGIPRHHIARLNSDGSLDLTFNPELGANFTIWKITLQNDGKIIISGDFTSYNGISCNRIARLNKDGSLDESFNSGTGVNGTVLTTNVQNNGKLIIGGSFTSYNGVGKNRVARIGGEECGISLISDAKTDYQFACLNTPISLITYSVIGATDIAFTGLPPDVFGTFMSNKVTISGSPSVKGTFNYTLIMNGECDTIVRGTIIVNNGEQTLILGEAKICEGTSTAFIANGGDNYYWSTGNTTSSIVVSSPGTYKVTVSSINGCLSTGSKTLSFYVKYSPPVNGDSIICSGTSTTWSSDGGTSYLWSTGQSTQFINLNMSGTYTVTITDLNGCSSSSNKSLRFFSNPDTNINVTNENCNGSSSLQWAKQFGCDSENAFAYTVITDKFGNVYTTGAYFGKRVDFDPGPDTFYLESDGGYAAYISKLDKDGNFIWAKSIGSIYGEGTALVVDKVGNLLATGSSGLYTTYVTKIDMNGNTLFEKHYYKVHSTYNISIIMDSFSNIYISNINGNIEKYTKDGNFIWEKIFGYNGKTRIGINDHNKIYIVGALDGVSIAQIDTSGIIVWEKRIEGNGYFLENEGIKIENNYIYITGLFNGTWDFDPGPDTFLLTAHGFSDAFVLKLDTSGNLIWVTQHGGKDLTFGTSITVDESGNVYSAGIFSRTSDFDPGPETINRTSIGEEDAYILKLSSSGKFIGVAQFGAAGAESGAYSIAVDEVGYLYSTGYFGGKVDFDPSNEIYNLSPIGSKNNIFVVKLCKNFNPQFSSEGSATFCEGESVTLSSINAKSYLWSSGETSQNILASNSGTYTVTVTNFNGCTSSATRNIIEALKPIVSIEGGSALCDSSSVTWTAIGGISYLWNTGNTMASINPTISVPYTVSVTDENGCTNSATKILDLSSPQATVSGITKICEGIATILTVQEGTTFLWNTGETSQSISVSANGDYVVTVTNENGCSAVSLPTTITVYPLPASEIVPNGPTTFCLGDNVILTASEAQSYIWSSGQTSRSVDITSPGSYVVTVTDANGCSAISSDMLVTVNELLTPTVAIMSSANAICAGENVTFNASATNSGTMPLYQWYVNGILQVENGPVFSTNILDNNQQVLCRMTSNAECVTQPLAQSNIISISVNPLLTPEVSISATTTSVVACQEVTFTATPTNGGVSPSYQWFLNGNPVSSSPTFSTSALINGDQISCIMTSSAACKSSPTATSNVIIVSVSPLSQPIISILGDTIFSSNYKDALYEYTWFYNGSAVSTSPFIICNQFGSGSYYLVINYNGCTVSSNAMDIVCTVPTKDIVNQRNLIVYPNPTNGKLNISGTIQPADEIRVSAYNQLGQKLEDKRISFSNDNVEFYLNMASYACGIYTIVVYGDTFREVFKVYKID